MGTGRGPSPVNAVQAELTMDRRTIHVLKTALDEHAIVSIADSLGRIVYVNDKFCEISQYSKDELLGEDHRILNSKHHSRSFFKDLWKTIRTGQVWRGEIKNCRKDGSSFWVATTIVPFMDEGGQPEQFFAVRANITRLKLNEEELKETRSWLHQISEATNDVFWMRDPESCQFLHVSSAYERIWGKSIVKLFADPSRWENAIIDDDRSKYIRGMTLFCRGEDHTYDEVYRIRGNDGTIRWIRDRGFLTHDDDGEIECVTGVATDITVSKELEAQVVEISEKERLRIGQDLHDDLCQRLAALKLACGTVARSLETEGNVLSKMLRNIETEMGEATSMSRTIAGGLSPVSLEEGGLMASLDQLAEGVECRFGIPCRFDCPIPVAVGNPTSASHVFRIAQELMNNAAKHAHATRILLGLYPAGGGFKLEVVNDGIPFRGPGKDGGGMGLHFMRSRSDSIGASLEFIQGKLPDGGTRVICLVPNRCETEIRILEKDD